jgi:DNA polymerase-1
MPDNLRSQIDDIEKMIELMGIHMIAIDWYEADDVIGTLAQDLWKDKANDIYILSWDKDLYALITENVKVYDTMKRKVFNREEATLKFWVPPEKVIDYLAIVWDKADNIPGIDGFWPKKAVDLINEVWWVEKIYEAVEEVSSGKKNEKDFPKPVQSCFKGKTFEKLQGAKDDAFLSKKLATLDLSVHLDYPPFNNDLLWWEYLESFKFDGKSLLNEKVKVFFRELEFNSLIWEDEKELQKWEDLWLKVNIIWDKEWLDDLQKKIKKYDKVILDTETTSLNIMEAQLTGVSIYLDDKNIFYINRMHHWPQIEDSELKSFLISILDSDALVIWHNIKYDLEIIELFLENKSQGGKESSSDWKEDTSWQTTLGF